MIQIDPLARSSTLVDLEAGRSTEIMELNGYVMQLCARRGLPCPANAAICEVVRRLEADAAASRPLAHIGVQELHDRLFAQ